MAKALERHVGVPVWEHAGIICTGETYKSAVKLTFAKGAALADPMGLFNASLDGNARRAIDIHEGDTIDAKAFKALISAAVALNTSARAAARPTRPPEETDERLIALQQGGMALPARQLLDTAKAGPPQTAAAALLRMRAPGGIVGGAVFSFSMAKPAADL